MGQLEQHSICCIETCQELSSSPATEPTHARECRLCMQEAATGVLKKNKSTLHVTPGSLGTRNQKDEGGEMKRQSVMWRRTLMNTLKELGVESWYVSLPLANRALRNGTAVMY